MSQRPVRRHARLPREPLDRPEDGATGALAPALPVAPAVYGDGAGTNSGTLPDSFHGGMQRKEERAMPAAATLTEL